jgi:hypothetical protein
MTIKLQSQLTRNKLRDNCKVTLTYHSGLSNYRLSRSVEFLRGYKSLVVVLLTHKQLEQ